MHFYSYKKLIITNFQDNLDEAREIILLLLVRYKNVVHVLKCF